MSGDRFCYVVLCHTDPEGVLRLCRRIRELSPTASVVLRHDQAGYITADQARAVGADLLRSTSVKVQWGAWSMCEATIEALTHARQHHRAAYYVVISGQDYPIRDLATWEAEVAASSVDALVHEDLPPSPTSWQYVWLGSFTAPAWIPHLVARVTAAGWRRVARFFEPVVLCFNSARDPSWYLAVRRLHVPYTIVKGSQWLTCSDRALQRVLARDANDRRLRRFFSHTGVPDEIYLQTIIHADPDLRTEDRPTTWTHFDFDRSWSPEWLTADLIAQAATSGAPFARKMPADESLRDVADRLVQNPVA